MCITMLQSERLSRFGILVFFSRASRLSGTLAAGFLAGHNSQGLQFCYLISLGLLATERKFIYILCAALVKIKTFSIVIYFFIPLKIRN